jgi:hypothetical protein
VAFKESGAATRCRQYLGYSPFFSPLMKRREIRRKAWIRAMNHYEGVRWLTRIAEL